MVQVLRLLRRLPVAQKVEDIAIFINRELLPFLQELRESTAATFEQVTTNRLLGRDSPGTGDVEEISIDDTLEFTGSGVIQRAEITGDVTIPAGSNVSTIPALPGIESDIADIQSDVSDLQDAEFITYSANASLTNERVATTSTTVAVDVSVPSQVQFQRAALTGDILASANSNTTDIAPLVIVNADVNAAAAIETSKLENKAGLSVLGVAGSVAGPLDDIVSTAGNQKLVSNSGFTAIEWVSDLSTVHNVTGVTGVQNPFVLPVGVRSGDTVAIAWTGTVTFTSMTLNDGSSPSDGFILYFAFGLRTGTPTVTFSNTAGTVGAGLFRTPAELSYVIDSDEEAVMLIYANNRWRIQSGTASQSITGAIAVSAGSGGSRTSVFSGIEDNDSAVADQPVLNFANTSSILGFATSVGSQINVQYQRAALTGFAAASANSNATTSAEPIVTYSSSANMSAERVTTSSTTVTVSTSVASQIEFQRAALTGAITATANSNATLFDSGASGAGLTGGGTAILAVGAGTGIAVNANDVAVDATWAEILVNSNNSGAFNPHIDTGQFIGFGTEGSLPGGSGELKHSGSMGVLTGTNFTVTAGLAAGFIGDITLNAGVTTGSIELDAGADVNSDVVIGAGNDIELNCASNVVADCSEFQVAAQNGMFLDSSPGARANGFLMIGESSTATATSSTGDAGTVAYWAENTSPTRAKVTDDVGAQWTLGYACVSVNTTSPTATNATTNLSCGGSYTIPANTARAGTVYRLHGQYVYTHTAATTPTITFEILIGGSVVRSVALTPVASAATYTGWFTSTIRFQSIGAGGTCMATWIQNNDYESSVDNFTSSSHTGTESVDTTADQAIEQRMRMTTAVASNTVTVVQGYIERLA